MSLHRPLYCCSSLRTSHPLYHPARGISTILRWTRHPLDRLFLSLHTTCVYSSVHFDLPLAPTHRLGLLAKLCSRDYWLVLWHKASFWLLGVFSPEMLVLHAFYEHMVAARDVRWMRAHGHAEWSLTLAFAADMRGLVHADGRAVRSGFALHERLFRRGEPGALDCAALECDLADRTKADTLFKLLTALQIARFFANTVVRVARGVPVAPLETVTCAYVLCTLVYYLLWLKKPYNVNESIVVRVRPELRRARPIQQFDIDEGGDEEEEAKKGSVVQQLKRWWKKTVVPVLEPHMSDTDRLHGSEHLYQNSPCKHSARSTASSTIFEAHERRFA